VLVARRYAATNRVAGRLASERTRSPRAHRPDDQRQLPRACERAGARDRALAALMLFTALHLFEAVALDLDDVQFTAQGPCRCAVRKGDLLR
jgi:integrase